MNSKWRATTTASLTCASRACRQAGPEADRGRGAAPCRARGVSHAEADRPRPRPGDAPARAPRPEVAAGRAEATHHRARGHEVGCQPFRVPVAAFGRDVGVAAAPARRQLFPQARASTVSREFQSLCRLTEIEGLRFHRSAARGILAALRARVELDGRRGDHGAPGTRDAQVLHAPEAGGPAVPPP
jgi:hypothetical protein